VWIGFILSRKTKNADADADAAAAAAVPGVDGPPLPRMTDEKGRGSKDRWLAGGRALATGRKTPADNPLPGQILTRTKPSKTSPLHTFPRVLYRKWIKKV